MYSGSSNTEVMGRAAPEHREENRPLRWRSRWEQSRSSGEKPGRPQARVETVSSGAGFRAFQVSVADISGTILTDKRLGEVEDQDINGYP